LKTLLENNLAAAITSLRDDGEFALDELPALPVTRSRGGDHGDFASPVALALARTLKRKPQELAAAIVARLPGDPRVERVEVAGPGFINFFLAEDAVTAVVAQVLEQGAAFGHCAEGAGRRVQVEYVSANPTGPLHVGHGRGAAYGAVVANLLQAVGYDVQREYYVNDAGRQMDILALSVWLRYLEGFEQTVPFPPRAYQGDYVGGMGAALRARDGDAYRRNAADVLEGLPAESSGDEEQEARLDSLIARCKTLLGERYRPLFDFVLAAQVQDIRADLGEFRVTFDNWFSERSLVEGGDVHDCVEQLEEAGHIYVSDETRWFRSSAFGDEKDRVVVRGNGVGTYFASDIAYLRNKFQRDFEHVIYVWGADHHGYVARLRAAALAMGIDPDQVEILLVQFAQLYRGGEKVQMSTRSGQFVTLRELREEVGADAARFFYVMRRCEQHLDFDLDLAKSQRNENPVHYVHYAHARIASTLRRAEERGMTVDFDAGLAKLSRLELEQELDLMRALQRYPEVVLAAARAREPHQVSFYLRDLAHALHGYYNLEGMRLLDEDPDLRHARLTLCEAVRTVLAAGLDLLGVSAPDRM
jgi:arginyl-tRNA synthetase